MWPWEQLFGIANEEAGATLWVGLLAAIIAIWGVISQRAITRRQVTMELLTRSESDKDLIAARARYIALTEQMGALVALADATAPPQPPGAWTVQPAPSAPPAPAATPPASTPAQQAGSTLTPAQEMQANIDAVRLLFNHMELLAIGIQMGIVDYTLFKRFAETITIRDWDRGAPLVYALRQKYNQESMYHEFEELARWLRGKGMPRRRRFMSLWR